jgi:hypothetical protein
MPSALPGYRVFALCGAAAICSEELTTASSLGLTPSYRVLRAPNGRCRHSHSEEQRSNNSTSLEVSSPSASPRSGQRHLDRPSKPAACACRFSQPLGAFIRPEPGGLVSCRIRSWGCTLQSLLLPCSRTLSPAPIPSCRSKTAERSSANLRRAPKHSTRTGSGSSLQRHRRLQGLAPHESPLAPPGPKTGQLCVALLGLMPSRAFPPAGSARPSPRHPTRAWLVRPQATETTGTSGYALQRDGLVSEETACPPGLLRLLTPQQR